jgi:glycosyltransferase involved in cell wall biosynthesis
VIEHSVSIDREVRYDGSIAAGATVVNNIQRRGRFTGFDLFQRASESVPLVAIGMGSEEFGGLGDIQYRDLHSTVCRYRFLFSPMRYTSLPLAVIEAMTIGMPVIALATTELPTVIEDGVSGYVSFDPDILIQRMRVLLDDPHRARQMGEQARRVAAERFGMTRFIADWNNAFDRAIEDSGASRPASLAESRPTAEAAVTALRS